MDGEPRGAKLAQPRAEWIVVVAVLALGALSYATRIRSYELWWHMATGRWVVEHLAVPSVDDFSYTFRGEPWRFVNWLGGLVLYGWYQAFGDAGLVPLKVLTMFACGGLLFRAVAALGVRASAASGAVFAVLLLAQPRFSALRPMVLGTVPLAAAMLLAARPRSAQDRVLWAFVPLQLVWTQLHGTAMIGLGILGVLAVAELLAGRPVRVWTRPLLVLVASVAAMCTTASGRALFDIVSFALGDDPSIAMMDEWQRMSLSLRFVWVPLGAGLLGAGVALWRRRWLPLGLVVLGGLLASQFVRNLYESILLFAPALGLAFEALVERLERAGLGLVARVAPYGFGLLCPLLQVSLISPELAWSHRHLEAHFGLDVEWSRYPRDTFPTLAALPEGRTLHDIASSGYLIWRRLPGGVFIDGRTTALYDGAWMVETYQSIDRSPEALDAVADRYGITYGLGEWERPYTANMMIGAWTPVHYGESSVVFVRDRVLRDLPNAAELELGALRYLEPVERWSPWLDAHYARLLKSEDGRERLRRAVDRARRRSGSSALLDRAVAYVRARGYLE